MKEGFLKNQTSKVTTLTNSSTVLTVNHGRNTDGCYILAWSGGKQQPKRKCESMKHIPQIPQSLPEESSIHLPCGQIPQIQQQDD